MGKVSMLYVNTENLFELAEAQAMYCENRLVRDIIPDICNI